MTSWPRALSAPTCAVGRRQLKRPQAGIRFGVTVATQRSEGNMCGIHKGNGRLKDHRRYLDTTRWLSGIISRALRSLARPRRLPLRVCARLAPPKPTTDFVFSEIISKEPLGRSCAANDAAGSLIVKWWRTPCSQTQRGKMHGSTNLARSARQAADGRKFAAEITASDPWPGQASGASTRPGAGA